jgi:hypothetical protein
VQPPGQRGNKVNRSVIDALQKCNRNLTHQGKAERPKVDKRKNGSPVGWANGRH